MKVLKIPVFIALLFATFLVLVFALITDLLESAYAVSAKMTKKTVKFCEWLIEILESK